MLKIIDVDWIKDKALELSVNDGFRGTADLSNCFSLQPFNQVTDFARFALTADVRLTGRAMS